MGWAIVRAISELDILRRASILALALVPVIAAIWPSVHSFFQAPAINSLLGQFRGSIQQAIDLIPQDAIKAKAKLQDILNLIDLKNTGDLVTSNYNSHVPLSSELPLVWVYAFLGSLAVLVGTLIYQTFAPQLVKQFSRDEYILTQLNKYSEHGNNIQIEEAIEKLRTSKDPNLLKLSKKASMIGEEILNFVAEEVFKNPIGSGFPIPTDCFKPIAGELITCYAATIYDEAAHPTKKWKSGNISRLNRSLNELRNPALYAFISYAIGGIFLVLILVSQTQTVLSARSLPF